MSCLNSYEIDDDSFEDDQKLPATDRDNGPTKHDYGYNSSVINRNQDYNKRSSGLSNAKKNNKSEDDLSFPDIRSSTKNIAANDESEDESPKNDIFSSRPKENKIKGMPLKSFKPIKESSVSREESNARLKSKDLTSKNDDYEEDFSIEESISKVTPVKKTIFNVRKAPPASRTINNSEVTSPKFKNKIKRRENSQVQSDVEKENKIRIKKHKRNMNRSIASTSDMKKWNRNSMNSYFKTRIKLNPLAAIELDIQNSKK